MVATPQLACVLDCLSLLLPHVSTHCVAHAPCNAVLDVGGAQNCARHCAVLLESCESMPISSSLVLACFTALKPAIQHRQ